jgi:hypothetical protein
VLSARQYHQRSSRFQLPPLQPLVSALEQFNVPDAPDFSINPLADVSYSPLHSSLLDVPKHFWMDNSNSRYPSREFTEPMKVHFPLPGLDTSVTFFFLDYSSILK